jgi:probable rRNA maturation factor
MKRNLPELVVLNRQRPVGVDLGWLRSFGLLALPLCMEQSADGQFALGSLDEVVVTLVSDKRIDRMHRQFMNIAGATDVITFEHGEIVISMETAQRCALEFGHSTMAEAALYLTHGLLHLNGFLDSDPLDREKMHGVQNVIWRDCLQKL